MDARTWYKEWSPDSNVIKDLPRTVYPFEKSSAAYIAERVRPSARPPAPVGNRPMVKVEWNDQALGGRSSAAMRNSGWKKGWNSPLRSTNRTGISVPRPLGTEVFSSSSTDPTVAEWPVSSAWTDRLPLERTKVGPNGWGAKISWRRTMARRRYSPFAKMRSDAVRTALRRPWNSLHLRRRT